MESFPGEILSVGIVEENKNIALIVNAFNRICGPAVFDNEKVEQAARLGIKGDKNLKYLIGGIVDFNSIPKEKRHLEIGIDENPVPLVHFLPDLNTSTITKEKKVGRPRLSFALVAALWVPAAG